MRIYLSPSQIASAEQCRRQHWYRSIAKVKVAVEAANLAFGGVVDRVIRNYLIAVTLGHSLPNLESEFSREWRAVSSTRSLSYASTQTPEIFEKMGRDLMEAFPNAWEQSGFEVATDLNSTPLVDVKLEYRVGRLGDCEVWMRNVLDMIVYTPNRTLAIVDAKSAAVAHSKLYARQSDQLTSYQLALDEHGRLLSLPSVDQLGFFDLLKRRGSSKIPPPVLVSKRTPDEVRAFRDKCLWIAEDIRRGRFPRSPRMQFNTPCELCDYAQHCTVGDGEGLVFPTTPLVASV